MFRRRRRKDEKGSMQIVEAAYVFPIMFFILLILIYMGNAFFIRAQVDAVAETYAIKGAEFCSDPLLATLEDTGTLPSVNELNTQPYRYLIDDMSEVEKGVESSIKQELTNSITFFRNMKPDFSSAKAVVADYQNYILYQTFSVDINYQIKIPLKMLWEKDFYVIKITSHATAPVNDTAEFVRNADMVVDLMQGTKIGNSIANAFKKVNNFVSNFASKSSTKSEVKKSQVASTSPTTGIVASGGTGSGSGTGGGTGGGSGQGNSGVVPDGGTQTGADTGTSGEGEGSDEEEEPPSGSGGIVVAETDDDSDYTSIAPINGQEWCDYYKEIYGEDAVTWETDPSVVLTDEERQEIIDKGRGNRPDPTTYLPADYIENHLASFHDGASKFILYSKFYNDDGSRKYETAGAEGTGSYFLPTWYADYLMETTGGDPVKIMQALNIPFTNNDELVLVRFDVDDPLEYDLRMPSGNESGANEEWVPGGYTKSGTPEAILTSPRYDDGEITIIGK